MVNSILLKRHKGTRKFTVSSSILLATFIALSHANFLNFQSIGICLFPWKDSNHATDSEQAISHCFAFFLSFLNVAEENLGLSLRGDLIHFSPYIESYKPERWEE